MKIKLKYINCELIKMNILNKNFDQNNKLINIVDHRKEKNLCAGGAKLWSKLVSYLCDQCFTKLHCTLTYSSFVWF